MVFYYKKFLVELSMNREKKFETIKKGKEFEHHGVRYEMLYTRKDIQRRVKELGKQIRNDYNDNEEIVAIGVLNGAVYFLADLSRELAGLNLKIDTMSISSYENGSRTSNKEPKILLDPKNSISKKHVLVVEDVADSGFSLGTLLNILKARGPLSIKTCVMFSKEDRREVNVPLDYVGFYVPDKWLEGYGLDTDGKGREYPCVVARL